jgi:hypothetical protein
VDWIQRVTHEAEEQMHRYDVPCWVEEVRRRKFRWAGHVARREDGRWTRRILQWTPDGKRDRGRPNLRWVDSIRTFFSRLLGEAAGEDTWIDVAQDREGWHAHEGNYVREA